MIDEETIDGLVRGYLKCEEGKIEEKYSFQNPYPFLIKLKSLKNTRKAFRFYPRKIREKKQDLFLLDIFEKQDLVFN